MKNFINDVCLELGAAVERAMCEWSDRAAIEYEVNCGKVMVMMDSNDDMDVRVIHNNGKIRKDENIKNAIYDSMSNWADMREAFFN